MKIFAPILIVGTLIGLLFSTTKLYAQNDIDIELTIEDYYCNNGLELDTCSYKPLYTELYRWINVPYRYAGNSFSGIDCSGLVKTIYKNVFNLSLTGGSRFIFNQVTPIESIDQLSEGDLLFFKIKRNQISHIGIYLFNGYFIHSSVSKGVIISNLEEDYYKRHFYSGGRIN